MNTDQGNTESVQALVDELATERKLREGLEAKVNELVAAQVEAERGASIRAELQKLGVAKVDLAFRAVRDELKGKAGEDVGAYLAKFVTDNPEFLPARITGGSGAHAGTRGGPVSGGVDLDKIRPGMSAEEMERVRQEIARVASQTLRGF